MKEYWRLEQRSVIKLFVAKKSKTFDIFVRMCNMNGEGCFSHKVFINLFNMGLPQQVSFKKTINGMETSTLWQRKRSGAAVRKIMSGRQISEI